MSSVKNEEPLLVASSSSALADNRAAAMDLFAVSSPPPKPMAFRLRRFALRSKHAEGGASTYSSSTWILVVSVLLTSAGSKGSDWRRIDRLWRLERKFLPLALGVRSASRDSRELRVRLIAIVDGK